MSEMSRLVVDIAELLDAGHDPRVVAVMLDIPVEMVYQVEENFYGELSEKNSAEDR